MVIAFRSLVWSLPDSGRLVVGEYQRRDGKPRAPRCEYDRVRSSRSYFRPPCPQPTRRGRTLVDECRSSASLRL